MAADVKNAELQMLNTGDVNFSGAALTALSPARLAAEENPHLKNCDFKNVYDAYAIKDIYSPDASITDCTFDNCGGGIYFEGDADKDSM